MNGRSLLIVSLGLNLLLAGVLVNYLDVSIGMRVLFFLVAISLVVVSFLRLTWDANLEAGA